MSIQSGVQKFYSQIRRKGGGTVDQLDFLVANSVTINKGDWLTLTAPNKVTQAATKSGSITTAVLTGASPKLIGVALGGITTNASGVATDGSGRTTIPVALFNEDTEVMLGIFNASAASTTQATIQANGSVVTYDLGIVTGGSISQWAYNLVYAVAPSANAPVTITEFSPESASNEQYGFVWVRPTNAAKVGA